MDQYFGALEELLVLITNGRPEVLTVENLKSLRDIRTPRSADQVQSVYGFDFNARGTICRPAGFLTSLDDQEYRQSALLLSTRSIRVELVKWDEIVKVGKTTGDLIDRVCHHICRWINPESMREGQGVRGKTGCEEVWEQALGDKLDSTACARAFGASVIALVCESAKELRKPENRPYLEKNSIKHDTHTYRERFACPAWVKLLDETREVFGTLQHPHVHNFRGLDQQDVGLVYLLLFLKQALDLIQLMV